MEKKTQNYSLTKVSGQFFIIAGIILLIALFSPAAYYSQKKIHTYQTESREYNNETGEYETDTETHHETYRQMGAYWFFGFYIEAPHGGSGYRFNILAIICGIILLFGTVLGIVTGPLIITGKMKNKIAGSLSVMTSILTIILISVWFFLLAPSYYMMSFGMVLGYVGSVLFCLAGVFAMIAPQIKPTVIRPGVFVQKPVEEKPKLVLEKAFGEVKYCHDCGAILGENDKFCQFCGTEK